MSDLLVYLTKRCHLDYIAQLTLTQECKVILASIDNQAFPLEEWNRVVKYLCSTGLNFRSVQSAKEYLIAYSYSNA